MFLSVILECSIMRHSSSLSIHSVEISYQKYERVHGHVSCAV